MRIAVVDDSADMRAQLSGYTERFCAENSIRLEPVTFSCGDDFLQNYKADFDIIIFDIDMPGTNGIDAARLVRRMDDKVVILFITNIAQYAINGYEVEAVDYVLKPISYYDFCLKLKRALRKVRTRQSDKLVLDTTQGKMLIPAGQIRYVEVLDHYMFYHTGDRTLQVRGSFREHMPVLREYNFSRCHKSYMVNLAYVKNIRSSGVLLGDVVVPLGRAYKESMMADYIRYLHG